MIPDFFSIKHKEVTWHLIGRYLSGIKPWTNDSSYEILWALLTINGGICIKGSRHPYKSRPIVLPDSVTEVLHNIVTKWAQKWGLFCCTEYSNKATQIAKFMGPTWSPPGSCRPQMGPMLTPWTLLSGNDTVSHHFLLKFDLVTYHTDNFTQNMHNSHPHSLPSKALIWVS